MTTKTTESGSRPHLVPDTPAPLSASPQAGIECGRELARRYLVNAVKLNASIAFSPDSEAALHTKMLCAKQIVEIAGVVPQVPALAQPHDDGSGERS